MKYGSLFSGIGGFDLGFDWAGMECAWQVEKDEKARAVLTKHWPNVPKYEDVRNVGKQNLAAVDLICGGFPCQDLSVAGRRAGLDGERSGLWFEFHRIIGELTPRWVVIENVPGLLSSNGGRDFAVILHGLAECGYYAAWRVLDAQYFGLAQRRKRVFIVASLGSGRCAQILFESEGSAGDTPPSREAGAEIAKDVAATIKGSSGARGFPLEWEAGLMVDQCLTPWDAESKRIHHANGIAPTIAGSDGGGGQRMPYVFGGNNTAGTIEVAPAVNAHGSKRYDFESEAFVCNAFNGYTGGADDNDAQGHHQVMAFDASRGQYTGDIAAPLRVNGAKSPGVNDGKPDNMCIANRSGIRRLTPTECERLQGFPDRWTDGQSDSSRYRQLGNAVAVPVAEWIGRRIIEAEASR